MIGHIDHIDEIVLNNPSVKNASMKALVSKDEGWNDHVMRVVMVKKDGYTPKHKHPWPHINYFLEGEGTLEIDGVSHLVKPGSYAYVPGDKLHQFKNTGDVIFKFICIVPVEGHIY